MENNQSDILVVYNDIPTILIVDDDPDIIEFINQATRIFKESRYKLVFATTGEGAITIVNIQEIDAVVLDIKLPDVTGINIGKRIKEHYPEMPVAIFSSYSGPSVQEQVNEIGGIYWYKLEKMANPEILLDSLNQLATRNIKPSVDGFSRVPYSSSEMKQMKERRKLRIDKLKFPSF